MADIVDDDEYFEIVDYTSASPLEHFISSIERTLLQWRLDNNRTSSASSQSAHLLLAEVDYVLTSHRLPLSSLDQNQNFLFVPTNFQSLHRWTCMYDFLTLTPTRQSNRASLDLSTAKLLLSAYLIAASNTGSCVPAFVPTGPAWKCMWSGVGLNGSGPFEETRISMIQAPYVPPVLGDVKGLIRLARKKMDIVNDVATLTIATALSYYYSIDEDDIEWREYMSSFTDVLYSSDDDNKDEDAQQEEDGTEVISLPYGPADGPLKGVMLEALFLEVPEDTYMEDPDSRAAPQWRLSLDLKEDKNHGLLSGILERSLQAWKEAVSVAVGDRVAMIGEPGNLPGGIRSLAVAELGEDGGRLGLVDINDIEDIVAALLRPESYPLPSVLASHQLYSPPAIPPPETLLLQSHSPVFFPHPSLLHHLTLRLLDSTSPESGLRFKSDILPTLKATFQDLVRELRVCWEVGMDIPGVYEEQSGENVGLRWGLLYQKFQMLNYCISIRRERGECEAAATSVDEQKDENAHSETLQDASTPSLSHRVLNSLSDLAFTVTSTSPDLHRKAPAIAAQSRPRPPLEATSWSSDRSWEDIKKRRESFGPGIVVGSLGAKSFSSFEDAGIAESSLEVGSPESPKLRKRQSDDDIFFDSMEDVGGDAETGKDNIPGSSVPPAASAAGSSWNDSKPTMGESFIQVPSSSTSPPSTSMLPERRGHKALLPFLSTKTGTSLYIPETLSPGPQTEDMIQSLTQHLEQLDPISRAKVQSKGLKSDMEAFKAANPGCSLEDFVRWWSPRDWIPDGGGDEDGNVANRKGRLSGRMSEAGNLWSELWRTSEPIPSTIQPPLFDHTETALSVLTWLENLSLHQLLTYLMPQALLITYTTLSTHYLTSRLPTLQTQMRELAGMIMRIGEEGVIAETVEDVLRCVERVERYMGLASAGWRTLPGEYELIDALLTHPMHYTILSPSETDKRDAVTRLMSKGNPTLPLPISREYIFRRANDTDEEGVKKVYALLKGGEFRVVETRQV